MDGPKPAVGATKTHVHACPHCGCKLDSVSVLYEAEAAPSPGDVSICVECGKAMVFTANGTRKPTPEEQQRIFKDRPFVTAHIAMTRIRAKKRQEKEIRRNRH